MSDIEMLIEVLRCVCGLVNAAEYGKPLDDVTKPDLSRCDEAYDYKVAWVIGSLMEFCSRYEWLKNCIGEITDIVTGKQIGRAHV